jgi:hypothetical protein
VRQLRPGGVSAADYPGHPGISPVAILAIMAARWFAIGRAAVAFGPWGIVMGKYLGKLGKLGSEGPRMPLANLLQKAGFKAEDTAILTEAFDQAWIKFKASGNPLAGDACAASTRALLAKRIIETAQTGERNVDRLVENGVTYLDGVK